MVIIPIVMFVIVGCATAKIQALRPGMTIEEVEDLLGKHTGYRSTGPTEVYSYHGLMGSGGEMDYDLLFLDGRLKEWWRTYSHRTSGFIGTGVILPTPGK